MSNASVPLVPTTLLLSKHSSYRARVDTVMRISAWSPKGPAHLSHMSNMKRQKEPIAIGPTCFQYPAM